jgi:hypothetical protein
MSVPLPYSNRNFSLSSFLSQTDYEKGLWERRSHKVFVARETLQSPNTKTPISRLSSRLRTYQSTASDGAVRVCMKTDYPTWMKFDDKRMCDFLFMEMWKFVRRLTFYILPRIEENKIFTLHLFVGLSNRNILNHNVILYEWNTNI